LLDIVPRPFVINLTMPQHLDQVLQRFPTAEFVQLSVARSEPIGDGHRLAAMNPVFVVTVPA
jgi:precorrin-6B methylase 2